MLHTINTLTTRSILNGVGQSLVKSGQNGRFFARNIRAQSCCSSLLSTHCYQPIEIYGAPITTAIHTGRRNFSTCFDLKSKRNSHHSKTTVSQASLFTNTAFVEAQVTNGKAISLDGYGENIFRGTVAAPYLKKHGLAADILDSIEWTSNIKTADKVFPPFLFQLV